MHCVKRVRKGNKLNVLFNLRILFPLLDHHLHFDLFGSIITTYLGRIYYGLVIVDFFL